MRRLILGRELPAIFTVALAGALLAFTNGQPAFGAWLLAAALWCALLWLLLLRLRLRLTHQPRQSARKPDKRHQNQHHRQHQQPRSAA